ncbi:SusD/RagB family nutrient-binding outer membrane lipoprotein [Mangrovibacterium lignilyticum]|uniref:SusD/RagB family nutrient-binding outer membrane lipoprotein n=1 Tax=Mangrovibacterium lignilyticum TaxID=2668052 RepID=UPI0013D6369A|nr:SusD/RagB family nutrient-binding outer membrane lipoprotein [Mangrovibacterium lignilyticum]
MKNRLFIYMLFASLVILASGCSDELDDRYNNPEKSTEASIPGFFTTMLNNNRVRPSYWNVRTFLLLQPAIYTQTAFFSNSSAKYQESTSYTQQYWNNFYVNNSNGSGVLSTYTAMEVTYDALGDADKTSMDLFMNAGKLVLIDEASKMIDMWGDIPFSEAGSLETSSLIANAAFDDQQALYTEFIADLKEIASYFGTASENATFSKYDILLSGSVSNWQRYANSLRLRLLMRISNVDESTAQTEVTEMLSNSSTYPLVDGGNNGDYSPASDDILLQPLTDYTDNLNSALTELPSHYAPDYMLNTVMKPTDDPRIPVIFDKYGKTSGSDFTPNTDYAAMPITFTSAEIDANYMYYSIVDSTTFLQNPQLPGIVITASEVNFLKAEAFERWGGGDAQEAYETALKQSVTFYYYLNNLNTTGLTTLSKPDDSVVDDFVASAAYTGTSAEKLGKIWTQKWVHFGFLQSVQAWSEYRRTGYPELTFPTATLVGYENPPVRLLYPDDEKSYNSANYEAVKDQDTRDTNIFWDVNN